MERNPSRARRSAEQTGRDAQPQRQEASVTDIHTPQEPDDEVEGDRETPADEMSSYDIAPPADDTAPGVPPEDPANE